MSYPCPKILKLSFPVPIPVYDPVPVSVQHWVRLPPSCTRSLMQLSIVARGQTLTPRYLKSSEKWKRDSNSKRLCLVSQPNCVTVGLLIETPWNRICYELSISYVWGHFVFTRTSQDPHLPGNKNKEGK